jgi:hypothetical protein
MISFARLAAAIAIALMLAPAGAGIAQARGKFVADPLCGPGKPGRYCWSDDGARLRSPALRSMSMNVRAFWRNHGSTLGSKHRRPK